MPYLDFYLHHSYLFLGLFLSIFVLIISPFFIILSLFFYLSVVSLLIFSVFFSFFLQ